MHKSHMIPILLSGNELAGNGVGARFRRVLRHARTPRSWPALIRKNIKYVYFAHIKYAFASRRPEFWNELGRDFAARRDYEEALACYDHALAIRGDIPQIWNNRGNALRNLDRLDEAEISLREALRLKPDFANAHNNLGRVLDYLGRFEEAEASVRMALRLEPEHAFAHFYSRVRPLPSRAYQRSRGELSHGIAPPTGNPGSGTMALGLALLSAGKFEEGWKEFEWRWQKRTPEEARLSFCGAVLER